MRIVTSAWEKSQSSSHLYLKMYREIKLEKRTRKMFPGSREFRLAYDVIK